MSWDLRGLAADDGLIVGAAADHRDSLRAELERRGLHVTDEEVGDAKARIAEALAPVASLLLLDVEIGAPAAIARGAIRNGPPLVLPLENQGYGDVVMAKINHAAYEELGRIKPLGGQSWTMPIVSDGKLYVRNLEALVCLDLK